MAFFVKRRVYVVDRRGDIGKQLVNKKNILLFSKGGMAIVRSNTLPILLIVDFI